MKYLMWTILILFVAALVFVGFLVNTRIDYFRYEKQVVTFINAGIQDHAKAKTDDYYVQLNRYNFEVMCSRLLTITERKRIYLPLKNGKELLLKVEVNDDNYFEIIKANPNNMDIYLVTRFDGTKRVFLISEKYRVYERALEYVDPDGFYGPNDIIEENDS